MKNLIVVLLSLALGTTVTTLLLRRRNSTLVKQRDNAVYLSQKTLQAYADLERRANNIEDQTDYLSTRAVDILNRCESLSRNNMSPN